jgi:hypothetical protein
MNMNMDLSVLERLIVENRERALPEVKHRDSSLTDVPGMASVLIGMRRSGKTFRLYQEMNRLLESGVPLNRILYMNFEDDRIHPLGSGILNDMLEAFYRLSPEARSERVYLLLDEIQAVEGWSRFARRVLDTENVRLFITGSSSKLLSAEVATEFRGRGYATELLPLSFREALAFSGVNPPKRLPGAGMRSYLEAAVGRYLRVGGFPAVQLLDENARIQVLQDYVEIVLLRDILERHGITNAHTARSFAFALLQSSGGRVSVHKMTNALRSRGVAVGKDTLHSLLDHFTDAYLLFPVELFSRSARVRQSNPRKVYCIDPGLAFSVAHAASVNVGALLENTVYLHLRRRTTLARTGSIAYYTTSSGKEVDFVVGDIDTGVAKSLVQVCADLSAESTRNRELGALSEAMAEQGIPESVVVTLNDSGVVETGAGSIRIVPAWVWLLDI